MARRSEDKPLEFPDSIYETLRADVLRLMGPACRRSTCDELAFNPGHAHQLWAEDYAEWLVRLAVVLDCLDRHGDHPRSAVGWIEQYPPKRRSECRAQRAAQRDAA